MNSKLVWSETVRKVMAGTDDLPTVADLTEMGYDAMCVEDFIRDG